MADALNEVLGIPDGEGAAGEKTTMQLEQSVLAMMLASPEHTADILASDVGLDEIDFPTDEHRVVFAAIGAALREGQTPSPTSIASRIGSPQMGGVEASKYLMRLRMRAGSLITFADDARALMEATRRRRLTEIARQLAADASRPAMEMPSKAVAEAAETALYALSTGTRDASRFVSLGEAAQEAVAVAAEAIDRGRGLAGISTGFRDLDRSLGGLQASDLIILGGRPGSGKTSLATNIACAVGRAGTSVGFFSLEMSQEQLAMRIISDRTGISSSRIRRGAIQDGEFHLVTARAKELASVPIFIDQTGGISIAQLATKARRMDRRHGLGLIVVDYLQLMSGTGKRRNSSFTEDITEITMGLKSLAKDLGLPVIALSQLSRGLENRDDKRPRLSDLRQSGSIEQDADVVMFVHREEYYLQQSRPADGSPEHVEWQTKMERAAGKAEVIIGKQRHGATGTVDLEFDSETTTFRDRSPQMEAQF